MKNFGLTLWNHQSHEGAIFRNMAKLVTGDGVARIIGLLTAPIITRIYLPEHMGVLSIFIALVSLLAPFATFRYSQAIPLPKNDGLALNLTVLSFIILSISSFILFFIFSLFSSQILSLLSMEQLIHYWWLLPIAFAGTGLYELLSSWAIRKREFKTFAKTKVWQKAIGDLVKIAFGFAGFKPLGLLIGFVVTQAGGILRLFRYFSHYFSTNISFVSKNRMRFLSKRYSDFPKYRIPSQFLLTLSARVPLFYFAWHFGANTTGQIGLALMMLSLPITLIGTSTGKAFYAEIARIGKKKPEDILKVTKNITKKLSLVSIIPFLILFIFGPWLFKIVFGDLWYEAGVFARILSLYLLTQFIYSPISEGIFNVFEKQSVVLLIEMSRVFMAFFVFFVSYQMDWNPNYTLALYSIGLSIHYMLATYVVFWIIKKTSL